MNFGFELVDIVARLAAKVIFAYQILPKEPIFILNKNYLILIVAYNIFSYARNALPTFVTV